MSTEGPDEVDQDIEQWANELARGEPAPEPMSFADEYKPRPRRPVELVVPKHANAFAVIREVKDRRFPAKRVAQSALALASALKKATTK